MRAALLGISAALLTGCTTIQTGDIVTNAVNCNVTRGSTKNGQGAADVDVLTQSGNGAGRFLGALMSEIDCGYGTSSSAGLSGAASDNVR